MFRGRSRLGTTSSPWNTVVATVRVLLFLTLGGIVLFALPEMPIVANLFVGRKPESPLVGLVAGHWQNDSGAVCADGLQEVDVNLDVSRRVANLLRQQGYRVEILPEFTPKLDGYRAAVLLAIHSDSCIESLSGFKDRKSVV
jgi:hypothetical protein